MPRETFHGPDVPTVLAQAQAALGDDAVLISLRRQRTGGRARFELVAADPATAAAAAPPPAWSAPRRLTTMTPPAPAGTRWEAKGGAARKVIGQAEPLVIALVGPTGAGKTTTIAKLANHPRVFGGRAVGLLCLDTYRIGAIEQSRVYAELSGMPLEVIYEPAEIPAALHRLADREVLLVDTAGRGPHGAADVAATREMLDGLAPAEVHLTLPAGLDPRLARRVIDRHRAYRITHLLATKLDEFPEDRSVFELASAQRLPMRWLTNGQEVPNDLRPASSPRATRAAMALEVA